MVFLASKSENSPISSELQSPRDNTARKHESSQSDQQQAASDERAAASGIPLPDEVRPVHVLPLYVIGIVGTHVLALAAFVPWLFSWTGVALVVAGMYVFGMAGVTLGYHRLLTHRGFTCPLWLERTFATLGVCCLQDTPARWVAIHRLHHQHSDKQPDPHSPLVNFFWGHVGWVLVEHHEHSKVTVFERYARDLLRDPYYLWLERRLNWLRVYVAHTLVFFLAGLAWGWGTTGEYLAGLQFGLSLLLWGVVVRTVVVWHCTWSVNSLSHIWGYRNHETGDQSRNNWLVALMTSGEGWHNNHHAEQRCAAAGHKWWEFDVTWGFIRLLETVGLAKNVIRPKCWSRPSE